MTKYPTPWQRKIMWASLTSLFVILLVSIVGSVVWIAANVMGFLQPILIPVAIGAILAYLLDPLVTYLSHRGFGRTKAVVVLFAIAFLAVAALIAWIVPMISVQSVNLAKELPAFTEKARDRVVDVIYRYERTFGGSGASQGKSSPAVGFVNWLLGAPSPSPHPTATPEPTPTITSLPGNGEVIAPAPVKLSSAERQRIQDWVQKQLPALERQLPDLTAKLWALVTRSIGGFLGATGFLLSLVMVPIYAFFLLKDRPSIDADGGSTCLCAIRP